MDIIHGSVQYASTIKNAKLQIEGNFPTWQNIFIKTLELISYSIVEDWKLSPKESEVTQSYLTLCDHMDYNLPCSSVHGIFQARVLEWVAISFSRGSSWPRDRTWVSCIVGRGFTVWANREVQKKEQESKLTCATAV